jgi:alkylation response protein AidB-like acyl-CoA dehydrogenase
VGSVQIGDVNTRITQDEATGKLLVNGEKYYSTGSIFADWIDLFAYDEVSQQHVIAAIDRHASGFRLMMIGMASVKKPQEVEHSVWNK